MDRSKCPSCGDAVHQHPLPHGHQPQQQSEGQQGEQESRIYRCGDCGLLYRWPSDKVAEQQA